MQLSRRRISAFLSVSLVALLAAACAPEQRTATPEPVREAPRADRERPASERDTRRAEAAPRPTDEDTVTSGRDDRVTSGRDETRAERTGSKTYRIIGVGDIMMGSDFPEPIMHPRLTPDADLPALIGKPLYDLLRSGDVTFGNMEGTVHSLPGPHKTCRNPKVCYVFRSPPFHADILKRLGFNMLSLANNHSGDFLEPGRQATVATFQRVGILTAGIDRPGQRSTVLTLPDGTRVGMIAFAPNPGTVQLNDIPRARRLVAALAKETDITIVSFHGGAEGAKYTRVPREMEIFLGEHRGDVFRFSRAMVDAGADIVFGHGPHVPRAVEVYKGRFIAYSLGNFWTYGRFNIRGISGVALVPELQVTRSSELVAARIHSVELVDRGVPRMDPNRRALAAVVEFTRRDFPEVPLRFSPDGRITGPGVGIGGE